MDAELEMAARHLARGRVLLEQQRTRVARLAALGCDTHRSAQLSVQMARVMESFERHWRLLLAERAAPPLP